MTTETSETPPESTPANSPIIARPGTWYRMSRYIMFIFLLVYGGLSIRDGFYAWQPEHWKITHPNDAVKSPWDIGMNQFLGAILPPLAFVVLVHALRTSRGQLRLEDGVIYVPGHPPVPLEKIQVVDRESWDRKGIAYVDYDLGEGVSPSTEKDRGSFRIDDYIYQRDPTDQIFAAIEAAILKDSPQQEVQEIPEPAPAPPPPKAAAAPTKPAAAAKPAAAPPAKPAAPVAKPPAAKPPMTTPPRPNIAARPPTRPPQSPPRPPQAGA